MSKNHKRKILSLILAGVIGSAGIITTSANAEQVTEGSLISPAAEYIRSSYVRFTIQNGVSTSKGYIDCSPRKDINVKLKLQYKKSNELIYKDLKVWDSTYYNVLLVDMIKTYSVSKGYTYRARADFDVGGEKLNKASDPIAY